jgi:hypothetical protein
MTYGSQTIQQQGRLIEVGSQEGSVTGEHGQGQIGKVGKNRSRKLPSICKHCGVEFYGFYGEKNEYCSQSCHNEFRVMKWLPCSACMAKVGIGSNMAGKLLFMNGANIRRHWKRRGIKRDERSGIQAGRLRVALERGRSPDEIAQRDALKHYDKACMEDIHQHRRFPDWSYIWRKEVAKRKAMGKYKAMSDAQKKKFNKKCQQNRSKKYNSDSDYRIKCREKIKEWSKRNPDKVRGYVKSSIKKRKLIDPGFRVQRNMRNRLKEFITSAKNGGTQSIRSLIGCSTIQLAKHIESGFTKKMNWDNYGTYWHVDHILPCASFDHNDPKQVAQCWHWTNLRALEARKNMVKSDLITEPQMQLLLCATH